MCPCLGRKQNVGCLLGFLRPTQRKNPTRIIAVSKRGVGLGGFLFIFECKTILFCQPCACVASRGAPAQEPTRNLRHFRMKDWAGGFSCACLDPRCRFSRCLARSAVARQTCGDATFCVPRFAGQRFVSIPLRFCGLCPHQCSNCSWASFLGVNFFLRAMWLERCGLQVDTFRFRKSFAGMFV